MTGSIAGGLRSLTTSAVLAAALAAVIATGPAVRAHAAAGPDAANGTAAEMGMLRAEVAGLKADLGRGVAVNGYYDFEYLVDNGPGSPSTFRQHHLSFFVGATRGPWRLFSEVEFEDGTRLEAAGGTVTGSGAVTLEHAWIDHTFSDALVLRGGKFLLPHYWNVNHYPNISLSTNRPLVVREVFPADTTGVMAYGDAFRGPVGVTWHAYTGNGQGTDAADDNENKAVGAHLSVHLGRLCDFIQRLDLGGGVHNERTGTGASRDAFDAWGVDAQFNARRVEVLAEFASRAADAEREGLYVQPSVRVVGEVRLFYRYDRLDMGTDVQRRHTLGVNVRPRPEVSLKVEVATSAFEDPAHQDGEQLAASVAMFF